MVVGVLAVFVGAGCSAGPAASARAELTIFAAASLKGVLEEATRAYTSGHPGTTVTLSTDSSSTLATQIEQGAPADVFLSADTTNAQRLVDGGFASGEAVTFASNALVIIVPSDHAGGVHTPADLARPGVTIIAAGDAVPISRYAQQLVNDLAKEPGYPIDFATAYAANVASREDNVAAIVAKVELGEGDAGIVYATDAAASSKVTTVAIPESADVRATYASVVVQASPRQAAAAAFLEWFVGPEGQAILSAFGFGPPD